MDARKPGGSSIKMSSSLNRSTFSKNCSQDARRRLSLLESSVDSYPESNRFCCWAGTGTPVKCSESLCGF